MQPKERRETGEQDLFRSRLDQIIDLQHALVRLARAIDWRFLEEKFGTVYTDKPGHPPLPTRLMAGLAILKHMQDLSDEALCEHWVENPYYQYFCGEEFFQHRLVFDRSSLTRWRQRMGEEKLVALLQESLAVATRTEAMKPADLARVIVDTTVQPKAVMFPTDAKLLNRARERLVRLAQELGVVILPAGRQVRTDQAPALCPCQAVQARQSQPEKAQDLSRPRHPRHSPQNGRRRGLKGNVGAAAVSGQARAGAGPPPARPKDLQPACNRGGMHRQGKSTQAL